MQKTHKLLSERESVVPRNRPSHTSDGNGQVLAQANDALLRRNEVQRLCALGRSTLWAKVREGTFPAPLKIGPRARAWTVSSVQAWIARHVDIAGVVASEALDSRGHAKSRESHGV